ncbi:MAG: alanine:cation symporter family protein, partial [Clostridia bacterium]|nr:alanine:cation symporter family protein [Clostridia bacterium]
AEVLASSGIDKTNMMQTAFTNALPSSFGNFGNIFIAICLLFFAFSTIISWNFFGRINAEYLFGKKFSKIYTVIAIAFIFLGSILSNDLVWELTDMFNNIMVIPNVLALFALGSMVVACLPKKNK